MDDRVKAVPIEQLRELDGFGDVGLRERERWVRQEVEYRFAAEQQGIGGDDLIPAREEVAGHERSDVTGTSRDEDCLQCGHYVTSKV